MSAANGPRKVKQSKSSVVAAGGGVHDHADLARASLSEADLRAARLRHATLTAAVLKKADLSHAELAHAQLNGADLGSAKLSHARADHANFSRAKLADADCKEASLRYAIFSRAGLRGADLRSAKCQHARFDHADLCGVDLRDARLDHAVLAGADLTQADLRGANLRYARNVTAKQLASCRTDAATVMPHSLAAEEAPAEPKPQPKRQTKISARERRAAARVSARPPGPIAYLRSAPARASAAVASVVAFVRAAFLALVDALLAPPRRALAALRAAVASVVASISATFAAITAAVLSAPRRAAAAVRSAVASFVASVRAALAALGAALMAPPRRAAAAVRAHPTLAGSALAGVLLTIGLVWNHSPLDQLAPSPPERVDHAMPAPQALRPAVNAALLVSWEDWAYPAVPKPETVAEVRAKPEAVALFAPDPVPEAAPLSLDVVGDPALEARQGQPAVLAEGAGTPDLSFLRLASIRVAAVQSMPLAKSKVRVGRMKPVKVALSVDAPPPPQAIPALLPPAAIGAKDAPLEDAELDALAPLTVVVSLKEQRLNLYRGTSLIETSKVSSGKRGHDTPLGVYSILQKKKKHASNIYSGAPMPWMQRLTRSGIALHGGVVPNHPASHGCVRLPMKFAETLYGITGIGANVVIAGDMVAPRPIEHAALFEPGPAPKKSVLASVSGISDAVADPSSTDAPLRILIARRTARDEVIDAQRLLAKMGHLPEWDFLGQMERDTKAGIRAFQKEYELPVTGKFTPDFVSKLYDVAGKERPPAAHLFVRQDFRRLYDLPVALREPERKLGTHVFTLQALDAERRTGQWTVVSLDGDDPASVLDRIEIPAGIRADIEARLTPESTLIVAEIADDSAILPEGDDFIVWAGGAGSVPAPAAAATIQTTPAAKPKPKPRAAMIQRPAEKPVAKPKPRRNTASRQRRSREADWRREVPSRAFMPWHYGMP